MSTECGDNFTKIYVNVYHSVIPIREGAEWPAG